MPSIVNILSRENFTEVRKLNDMQSWIHYSSEIFTTEDYLRRFKSLLLLYEKWSIGHRVNIIPQLNVPMNTFINISGHILQLLLIEMRSEEVSSRRKQNATDRQLSSSGKSDRSPWKFRTRRFCSSSTWASECWYWYYPFNKLSFRLWLLPAAPKQAYLTAHKSRELCWHREVLQRPWD